MRHIHALTPGDHFSPRTGSAVATVVHGLATHANPRPAVLVARGTFEPRYSSCEPIEYDLHVSPHGASRLTRGRDVALGRLGVPRPWARMVYGQVLVDQASWPPSYILGHNAPQLVPLVSERHAPVLYVHNDLMDWYSRREARSVLDRVHRIICVSGYTADHLSDKLSASLRERVRVVRNGVDRTQFEVARSPRSSSLRVGYIGRVIPRKGVHVLVDAVARLGRSDIELTVVGSSGFSADGALTPYEQQLRGKAEQIPGPVTFRRFVPRDEVPEILGGFDVLVMPAVEPDAYPLTILEGMAAGCAVIASTTGGIEELVADAGVLVAPGEVSQLAEAIAALADSEEEVASLVYRGRRRVEEHSWERSARALDAALG